MTLRQFYLTKLAEECSEVSQRALKSMQFGEHEFQPGQNESNRARLTGEVLDLLSVIQILEEETSDIVEITDGLLEEHLRNKRNKIKKYLELSQNLGMVERG